MTLLVFGVMIAYISRMGSVLLTREDPTVSTYTQLDQYKSSEMLQLNKIGFKMAFGVYEYKTREPLNDPSVFDW